MPAGPSTSAGPIPISREPGRLTRPEFAARVFGRVRARYDLEVDDAWLHDLIKDALIPGADDRERNDGLRPVYTYGFQSYRRALQIARLRRDGFFERDAIRIQLFLKGYGELDIRPALWNQYSKCGRSLAAQVRSGYADNWKTVPDGHKTKLITHMGPLDPRLASAGFRLNADKLIHLFRAAKQKDLAEPDKMPPLVESIQEMLSEFLNLDTLADRFKDFISGALMFSATDDQAADRHDPIEELIMQSTDEQYQQAREFFRLMTSMDGVQIVGSLPIGHDAEARHGALKAVRDSARGDPCWAALLLVASLMLVCRFGGINVDNF